MKKLLLCLGLISFNSYGLVFISDLDDTFKVTNVKNLKEAARNALFSTKTFQGSNSFFQEVQKYPARLAVVSASPSFLEKPIIRLLEHNEINVGRLVLRNILREIKTKEFKIKAIENIISENPNEQFILVGDNTEHDPEVYSIIKEKYPKLIKEVYIRKVLNKPIGKHLGFFSFADVAVNEYERGRMGFYQTSKILSQSYYYKEFENLFPLFSYCPKKVEEFPKINSNTFGLVHKKLHKKIISECVKRF